MKLIFTKISLFLLVAFFFSCNAIKQVKDGEHLLTENTIIQDGKKDANRQLYNQLRQQPNIRFPLLDTPLRLHIYNLAKPDPDSAYQKWLHKKPKREERLIRFLSEKQVGRLGENYVNFNNFIKETGQAPVVLSEEETKKSVERLKAWYWNHGWFNAEATYKIDRKKNKRAKVAYDVQLHHPYTIGNVSKRIDSEVADSLYEKHRGETVIVPEEQFNTDNFEAERERITEMFRNNGLYHFDQEYITFDADTLNTNHKANIDVVITDHEINKQDTSYTVPYRIHRISEVNIFTDYSHENQGRPMTDSIQTDGYTLYGFDKIAYKPKAIIDAVFIKKDDVYRDRDRSLTYRRINGLRVFNYPNIQYEPDTRDTINESLIANIFLTSKPKFGVDFNFDVSRSNIQDFGISFGGSLLIRNVFGGAETLEIGGRGSIGSSRDAADSEDRFFNISEIGADANLSFPKIAFPVNTEGVIPKSMYPFTILSVGFSAQNNIGLDKQNVTGKYTYRWNPSKELTHQLDLLDLQYVRNLNVQNYFNVYRNSFNRLNTIAQEYQNQLNDDLFESVEPGETNPPDLIIPEGVNGFINEVNNQNVPLTNEQQQEARNIIERKNRLTENNLIFGTGFSYTKNTRKNIYDENFTQFRFKLESVGNTLSLASSLFGIEKNDNDNYDVYGVQFSQYAKGEIDLIKHWDLGEKNILAVRALGGIAIPFGNANSIPFARSFFAGGANDNRGWQAYRLGPGSSGGVNEFNEANMKIALSGEYRFNLFGSINSAFFIDVGNIWNVMDNVEDEASRFTSLSDLTELAVGSGFGLRYDLDFFVIRLDIGFKTYNPAYNKQTWFEDYNFSHAVYNVGINYPF